ncbi:cell division control protein 42 homolog [Mytilus galloprovincialis]|uniref:Ras homolog gene family, member Q n=1 Tax=Mytilus galloprovincialis TaxID=29158 RepID=A0A8B6H514_MYTGA|nr:Ras homolog gene family, member Q [Mytilus galloprovincialis]
MVLTVMEQTIQCCIVGDGMVGKSSIIKSFIEQSTPGDYVATISDSYSGDASFIGVNYTVSISDCTGEHENNELRCSHYKDTDVFVVCYSVTDRESFDSVRTFWLPEIRKVAGKKPVILVATQTDSRGQTGEETISKFEGLELADEIGADHFTECSSVSRRGIPKVFEYSIQSVLKHKKSKSNIVKRLIRK